jgi:hypothetical protein
LQLDSISKWAMQKKTTDFLIENLLWNCHFEYQEGYCKIILRHILAFGESRRFFYFFRNYSFSRSLRFPTPGKGNRGEIRLGRLRCSSVGGCLSFEGTCHCFHCSPFSLNLSEDGSRKFSRNVDTCLHAYTTSNLQP